MLRRKFTQTFALFVALVILQSGFVLTISAQNIATRQISDDDARSSVLTMVTYPEQITKQQVKLPKANILIVINPSNSPADIDFSAFDSEENGVGRETITVDAGGVATISLLQIFPDWLITGVNTIEIQSSVRPEISEIDRDFSAKEASNALQLQVAFFSQRDSRWSGNQLGTCTQRVNNRTVNLTIGDAGCAITSIAMAGARSVNNFNPGTLNSYLKNNQGYSGGCNVIWSRAADVDGTGGFKHIGSGTVASVSNLKAKIDSGQFLVVKSTRFVTRSNPNATHYGVIIGYNNNGSKLSDFYYLDPWDQSATIRKVGDGWVGTTSSVQIYK